jgi:hypothetical protein
MKLTVKKTVVTKAAKPSQTMATAFPCPSTPPMCR